MAPSRLLWWSVGLGTPLLFMALLRITPSLRTATDAGVVVRELLVIAVPVGWLAFLAWQAPFVRIALGRMRPHLRDVGWGAAAACLMLVLSVSVSLGLKRLGFEVDNRAALGSLATRPVWLLVLIVLTAAISEEIVFRAVLMPYVAAATGSMVIAVLLSVACFALAHLNSYGWVKVLVLVVPGFVMPGLFAWKRSLPACITAHLLVDFIGLSGLIFLRS